MMCDEIERQQIVIEIAQLKEAVRFLLAVLGELDELYPVGMYVKKYRELLETFEV